MLRPVVPTFCNTPLVIGSELFVKTTMANARGVAAVKKRKLVRALNTNSQNVDLYCFKQLRVLLE